jgi:D-3-phosphoglycerate dehydrogenase
MSTKIRILVCDRIDLDRMNVGDNFSIDYVPGISREELLRRVKEYDVLVVRSRTRVDRDVIDAATSLKIVARPGTGLDNVDVEYARKKGIEVVNSPEALVEAVSEHTILLMLSLCRNIVKASNSTISGKWEKEIFVGKELRGKKLGIIGLGRIGQRVASLAKAFGMSIVAYDIVTIQKDIIENLSAEILGLENLLSFSDFITIHVPLTDQTYHMINEKRLNLVKASSYIVNTSRGSVIDEVALVKALHEGRIAGAALDVFETEPPSPSLRSAPNVILTPHIGGQTEEAQREAVMIIAEKIRNYFNRKERS